MEPQEPTGEGGDKPRRLHHCAAGQFIAFGEKIDELQRRD